MKTSNVMTIWAADYVSEMADGETVGAFTNLRELRANVQTDYSELDLREYGETVNEMIKIRTDHVPDLVKGSRIYFAMPSMLGTVEVDGVLLDDYGEGDYLVESIKPAYIGVKTHRNPTVTVARMVTK